MASQLDLVRTAKLPGLDRTMSGKSNAVSLAQLVQHASLMTMAVPWAFRPRISPSYRR